MEEIIFQKLKLCEVVRIILLDIINRVEILYVVINRVKENFLVKIENVLEIEIKKMENYEKELRIWIFWLFA